MKNQNFFFFFSTNLFFSLCNLILCKTNYRKKSCFVKGFGTKKKKTADGDLRRNQYQGKVKGKPYLAVRSKKKQ